MTTDLKILDKKDFTFFIFKHIEIKSAPAAIFVECQTTGSVRLGTNNNLYTMFELVSKNVSNFLEKYRTLLPSYSIERIEVRPIRQYSSFASVGYRHPLSQSPSNQSLYMINITDILINCYNLKTSPVSTDRLIKSIVDMMRYKNHHTLYFIEKDSLPIEVLEKLQILSQGSTVTHYLKFNNDEATL